MADVSVLQGRTLTRIDANGEDELHFYTQDGAHYKMHHYQDCCEYVYLADVIGDFKDLIGSPLILARESTNRPDEGEDAESFWRKSLDAERFLIEKMRGLPSVASIGGESETWTFYQFSTIKGSVTLRWYGSSNGYYSESVDFEEVL